MQNNEKRARGRPRAFDRDAALGQATRLFWRKGYAATSISDLTEAMGIGAPSLYAAFGSKEALYGEALRHYGEQFGDQIWSTFAATYSARGAVEAYLRDSAAALAAGELCDDPRGCMVTLSAVDGEGPEELGAMVRSARAGGFDRVRAKLALGVASGEIAASVDIDGLARFVQAVQGGMSLLARDGATRSELEAVATMAMAGWDERVSA